MLLDPIASGAAPEGPGPPDTARTRNPTDAVAAFLEAVKAKDAVRLRNATSIRAPTYAVPENQPLFRDILDQHLSEVQLTELASRLEGFQAIGRVGHFRSGRVQFLVSKPGPNDTQFQRRFTVLWRKETGWPVGDIGEPTERRQPGPTRPKS
jgi:hypothetical protein